MDNCRGDNKIKQEEQALNEEAIVIVSRYMWYLKS